MRESSWRRLPAAALRGLANSFCSGFALARIEASEIRLVHQYLTADIDLRRRCAAVEPQRNGAHGADVGGDILAGGAIAARGRLGEDAVFIAQVDRQTVEFELGRIFDFLVAMALRQRFFGAAVEGDDVGCVETVVQRQHRHRMRDLRKLAQRGRADALGGRVRAYQLRMCCLERLQFAEQLVVFGVGMVG